MFLEEVGREMCSYRSMGVANFVNEEVRFSVAFVTDPHTPLIYKEVSVW